MFTGVFTALITPMKQGAIDEQAFQDFVTWQCDQGVHGLVPCGTTGESPTMTHDEHNHVMKLCVEAAAGKVPVIAGTGSNSTAEAIALSVAAQKAGADGLLVVVPYYNKPTPEGLYAHFKAVQDAVSIPIIIYNIPGRSAVNMSDALIAHLAKLPNIAGVKDATADLARVASLLHLLEQDGGAEEFSLLSGEDVTALALMAMGGQGCISVTSNIAPQLCAQMHNAWFDGSHGEALTLHKQLVPLHDAMFCETSPGPVKYAASLLGKCSAEMRLPLVGPSDSHKEAIQAVMRSMGLC